MSKLVDRELSAVHTAVSSKAREPMLALACAFMHAIYNQLPDASGLSA